MCSPWPTAWRSAVPRHQPTDRARSASCMSAGSRRRSSSAALLFTVPAIAVNTHLMSNGARQLTRARSEQDVLVGHFRSLIDGFRELKLHRARREAVPRRLPPRLNDRGPRPQLGRADLLCPGGKLGPTRLLRIHRPRPLRAPERGRRRSASAGRSDPRRPLYQSPLDVVLAWVPILGRGTLVAEDPGA